MAIAVERVGGLRVDGGRCLRAVKAGPAVTVGATHGARADELTGSSTPDASAPWRGSFATAGAALKDALAARKGQAALHAPSCPMHIPPMEKQPDAMFKPFCAVVVALPVILSARVSMPPENVEVPSPDTRSWLVEATSEKIDCAEMAEELA